MAAAWLLTIFALGGIALGLFPGHSRGLSANLAASGGGLLSGIGVFWLLPEIAEIAPWWQAAALVILSFSVLFAFDALLHRLHELVSRLDSRSVVDRRRNP